MTSHVINRLLQSEHAPIRYRALTELGGVAPASPEATELRRQIPGAPLVAQLLGERQPDGTLPHHPYQKWRGAHWVLAALADLAYPPADDSLIPLAEQVLGWLLGEAHQKGIRAIEGRVRRCASQEGNALYALVRLGLADERARELARELSKWQWPDGGWNCDKKPDAHNASFMETLIPLRGLVWYSRLTGDRTARETAERAAEVFLKRELFRGQRDGKIINSEFVRLHYPCYWHYDILFALKMMGEGGWLADARCSAALDRLESKRLEDGGFPAEASYYRVADKPQTGTSRVDWGGTSKLHMNEWVTLEALSVLKQAGRLAFSSG